jgi:hypothetical protein
MSETIRQSFWYKLRYTPVRDFLRGRLSARMDFRGALEQAALPPAVQEVVQRVVDSARLWRLERLEVVHELIAHFKDGIAAGVPPEELIRRFGDTSQAAMLIRRAKRRNRPILWHGLRITAWSAAVLFAFYCGYAVYFLSGRPSPHVNYVAAINERIEKTPVQNRAWPLYRRALRELGPAAQKPLQWGAQFNAEEWQTLSQFVTNHPEQIELIREGGGKPAFGFLLASASDASDGEPWPESKPPIDASDAGEDLASAPIPSLLGLRNLAALLGADAGLARQAHDGKRFLRDIDSTLGLSRQLGESGPLICSLAALSIYETALDQIEVMLREEPSLIAPKDWTDLAHRLAAPKVAGDFVRLETERMAFEDMLQRSFTDDGAGDGRLTAVGARRLFHGDRGKNRWMGNVLDPGAAFLMASRKDLRNQYGSIVDRAEANLQLPLRNTDWHLPEKENAKSWRYFLVWLNTPEYLRVQAIGEQALGRRDGVVVGIALEVFRREHGNYPENLKNLVPQLLPEVPADRITGEPVRYRLVNARPLVYSVGLDRQDDEGRIAAPPLAAAIREVEPTRGDWLLYNAAR